MKRENRAATPSPIAIYYEHPEWFKPLFAELDRRGVPYERLLAQAHCYDPAVRESPYALIVNRMSPSAYTRGHTQAILYTLQYLAYLVEYLVNERDGQVYFYDVNALSNFVADAPNVVGFDPWPRFVDFVLARAGMVPASVVG